MRGDARRDGPGETAIPESTGEAVAVVDAFRPHSGPATSTARPATSIQAS
jgi:hypothetical protein